MPELIIPDVRVRISFLEAMAELEAEDRGESDDDAQIGSEMRDLRASPATLDGFAQFVAALRAQAAGENLPAGYVACTSLWWVSADQYLGRIAIRHHLNAWLREVGGHIGYEVRPTARRRGHATAMLRAALPVARCLGIETALITCNRSNIASRKIIQACGGQFDDERNGKLRYWVSTAWAGDQ